jgi:Sap, sulfolipid-1-addressing protein
VGETASRIALFALVAGVSPIALVATVAVLTSRRGRANGTAFVAGCMLGQSAAFLAAYLVGTAATTDREANEHVAAGMELAFGLALLVLAWPQRRRPRPGDRARPEQNGGAPGEAQESAAEHRLRGRHASRRRRHQTAQHHDRGGRPRRHRRPAPVEDLALGLLYVTVAGVLVWLPVSVHLVAGTHADVWMASAQEWLTANERRITFASTVLFGFSAHDPTSHAVPVTADPMRIVRRRG